MGKLDLPLDLRTGTELNLPANVYVIASPTQLEQLESSLPGKLPSGLHMVPLPPDAPIPTDIISAAAILVVEVDRTNPASLARVGQVRTKRPDLPLIVALEDATLATVRTLIRQGVSDVTPLPFDAEELLSQLFDAGAERKGEDHAGLAPMVAVLSSDSSGGATTVLTHLVAAMGEISERTRRCCLIDLDMQFGEASSYLGISPTLSVIDLLEAGDRLDAEFMRSAAMDTGRGFSIIRAPEGIAPLESVDMDQLLTLFEIARREYDLVLLDLPSNWTNWSLSTALACKQVILLTGQTLNSLRQAKRVLEMFASVGLEKDRIGLVVNRVEKRLFQTISVNEVADALGHDVIATLAADYNLLSSAQDQGMLAWDLNKRARFAKDIRQLATQLDQILAGTAP